MLLNCMIDLKKQQSPPKTFSFTNKDAENSCNKVFQIS